MKNLNLKDQAPNKIQKASNKIFDLEERTAVFGERVIACCQELKADHISRPIISQLGRSATSIGANYAEANNASSKRDFRNKIYIAKKEAQETKHWLRMLAKYDNGIDAISELQKEVLELILILQAIISKIEKG